MLKITIFKEKKKLFYYSISAFIILSLAYLLIAFVIQVNSDTANKNKILEIEEKLVDVEKTVISNKIDSRITDVLFISDSLKFNNISNENYLDIQKQWIAFADRKQIYDQIRYIDIEGNEIIRINYSEDGAYTLKREDLQNKQDRYYFKNTIHLDQNQIYISKLDLNVENNKIDDEIKPMIRLSTPHYDDNGKLMGIIILNYKANDILNTVNKIASTDQRNMFMVNSDSYWLYNSKDRAKEWTFLYDDKKHESFKSEFTEEWDIVKGKGKGSLITPNGVFAYTNVLTNLNNPDTFSQEDWYIISHLSSDSVKGKVFLNSKKDTIFHIIKNNILILILILFISLVFGLLITINRIKNKEIKYFSEYDAMTGVYNRRAGLEKLNKICSGVINEGNKMSICFIDINGLKEVNDLLGHESGDELILSIVNGIEKNIGETNFITRVGGDEFLIILQDMDEIEAEKIWQHINNDYKKINENENRRYIISASHGIEEFSFNSNKYIESVINGADEKMYKEKKIIKKHLKVIKE